MIHDAALGGLTAGTSFSRFFNSLDFSHLYNVHKNRHHNIISPGPLTLRWGPICRKSSCLPLSLLLFLKAAPVTAPFWQYIYDVTSFNNLFMCHVKIGLIILVAVIPKEGLAGTSAAKISFDVTLAIEWYSVIFYRLCLWMVWWCQPRVVPSCWYLN